MIRRAETHRSWITRGFPGVIAAVAAALNASLAFAQNDMSPPCRTDGDAFPIMFLGLCPGETGEVFDADGNKIGETAGTSMWGVGGGGASDFEFIFDIPQGDDDVLFGDAEIRVSGSSQPGTKCFSQVFAGPHGRRLHVRGLLPQPRKRRAPSEGEAESPQDERAATHIDVTLNYWRGPRGEAAWTFPGPFEPGKPVPSEDGATTVTAIEYFALGGDWGTVLEFSADLPREAALWGIPRALAYNTDGRRFLSDSLGGAKVFVHRLAPERLAAVTVLEKACRKTFHGIRVAWPSRALSDSLHFQKRAADALGITIDRDTFRGGYLFSSSADAIKVIDCAIGDLAFSVWHGLSQSADKIDFEKIDAATKAGIVEQAFLWLDSDDHNIRAVGLDVALMTQWPEFVPRLFERVETDVECGRTAALGLCYGWRNLTPEQIRDIGKRALERRWPGWHKALFTALEKAAGDERLSAAAKQVLLDFAASELPHLWWRALESECVRNALGPPESWPQALLVKRDIIAGLPAGEESETRRDALKMLPSLLTLELSAEDIEVFLKVFAAVCANLDRETATGALVRFLEACLDAASATDPSLRAAVRAYTAARVVAALNRLHGIDIGGIGDEYDERFASDPYAHNWVQVLRDAVLWAGTGAAPRQPPAGYRARAGDLRAILLNDEDSERSVIAVWGHPENAGGRCRVSCQRGPGAMLSLSAWMTMRRMPGSEERAAQYKILAMAFRGGVGGTGYFEVDGKDLPARLDCGGKGAVVIERADTADSVLSDTKVFEDWWEKYGPHGAGESAGGGPP